MSNEKKEGNVVGQIAVGILVALIAGGTSPWWWDKFFGNNSQPSPNPTEPMIAPPALPPTTPPEEVPPVSQALCQYKNTAPIRISIKPDKALYTNLELINVAFNIVGSPENSKHWMTVVEASKPEDQRGYEWYFIGKEGSVSFKSKPPGDYKVRLFINTGSGDVPVGNCFITVKPIQ